MGRDERFWVPQSDIPPNEILIIFLLIHTSVLIFLLINYTYINSKLSYSGMRSDHLPRSDSLFKSLKLIYLGLGLIILDNIMTHFLALFYRKNSYFSVGARSTTIIIGFTLFFVYTSRFLTEVLRVPKSFKPRPMPFIRTMKYGYLFVFLIILLLIPLGVQTWILSWIFILTTGLMGVFFTTEFYIIYTSQLTDQVNKLRTIIAGFLGLGMIALLIFSVNFLPNRNIPPAQWPTRDARVEVLIFGTDIWVFYSSSMIILMVTLPRNIRLLFGISDEEFNLYRDERLDLDWDKISRWDLDDVSQNDFSQDFSSLVFIDPKLKENGCNLQDLFEENVVFSINEFQDPYMDNYLKDRSDLILITGKGSEGVEEIFQFINDYYDFKLQINEYLQVNSFVYKLEGYSCGMMVCVPSFWNSSQKLWVFIGSENNISGIIDLYSSFLPFFNMIVEEEQLFVVAKFPVTGEGIEKIGHLPSDPEVPDFRNLIFL